MKKKLLILISMLAMMFSLTACSNEVEKPFDYDDSAIVRDTMYAFEEYRNVNDEFADYYINDGTEFEQSAVKGIKQAQDTDKVTFLTVFRISVVHLAGIDDNRLPGV